MAPRLQIVFGFSPIRRRLASPSIDASKSWRLNAVAVMLRSWRESGDVDYLCFAAMPQLDGQPARWYVLVPYTPLLCPATAPLNDSRATSISTVRY